MKPILLSLLLAILPLGGAMAQTCLTTTIAASTPTARFTDNGDGTLTDDATGLMWMACSEGQSYNATSGGCDGTVATYTWQLGLERAGTVNFIGFAGKSDWRLPNQKELSSIVERQCVDPAINTEVFPDSPSNAYWSSSPYAGNALGAFLVDFAAGTGDFAAKDTLSSVRLVRGGE